MNYGPITWSTYYPSDPAPTPSSPLSRHIPLAQKWSTR